ncbi:MAG: NMD3-related protein [Candidatus Woesearchaeota archaeon]
MIKDSIKRTKQAERMVKKKMKKSGEIKGANIHGEEQVVSHSRNHLGIRAKTVKKDTHAHKVSHLKKIPHKMTHVKRNDVNKALHVSHKHYSKKFCPNCGNVVTDESTFCKDCRMVDFDFKEIKILLCNNCKSYNHKNKWQRLVNLDDAISKIVSESVKHHLKYHPLAEEKVEELLSYKAGVHRDFTVEISIGKEHFDLPAIIDVTLCPKCSKQGTKYFEGILQVRNSTDEINAFIKKDAQKQKSKGIHINKEIDLDGTGSNIDYYYTDKGYIKNIAERLRSAYGATIKQNAQLFSLDWSTSKNIYRLNVLVEFPNYHKNDVIKIGKQLFKIISMDEKIHVVNIENESKTLIPHKDSYDVLKPVEVMVIKRYPEFEILDPNTYYQARLMNPSDKLQINQKIHVIIDGGEAWMV